MPGKLSKLVTVDAALEFLMLWLTVGSEPIGRRAEARALLKPNDERNILKLRSLSETQTNTSATRGRLTSLCHVTHILSYP